MFSDTNKKAAAAKSKAAETGSRTDGQNTRREPTPVPNDGLGTSGQQMYEKRYGGLASRLELQAQVSIMQPWGEETTTATGLWDTGATHTVISKQLAERMGANILPPDIADGEVIKANNSIFVGTTMIRMRIGPIVTPPFMAKVDDFNPAGKYDPSILPDFLIGMNLIASGTFEVDSSSGETIVKFAAEF